MVILHLERLLFSRDMGQALYVILLDWDMLGYVSLFMVLYIFMKMFLNFHLDNSVSNLDYVLGIFKRSKYDAKGKEVFKM